MWTRRRFLKASALGVGALAGGSAREAAGSAGNKRPNIVWLVTEDNSASWLRLYDPAGAPMPNIERLAQQGIVFNHAFSCGPVCSVARSTIISGCYAPRVGVQYHRKQETVPMPEGIQMFPYYLRQAGYHTTNCSKEDYNFHASAKRGVWDDSSRQASYRNRQPGQPFFHVQNYGWTHESCLHPNARNGYYEQTKTDPASVRLAAYHPDTETFRHTYARYYDRHTEVDQQMGQFIQQLEEDGLLDDTFIFYYGDHGGPLPRGKGYAYNNGLQIPMVVYVPENWKHLAPAPAGSRVDGFVQFIDLSATVLNLADVAIPKGIDGKPFLGSGVSLEELIARDMSFGYADRFDEKYDLVRTLRKGRFHYVRNYQPFNFDGLYNEYRYKQPAYKEWLRLYRTGRLNAEQRQFFEPRPAECLYDLENDPDEVRNLAGDPAHAEVLLELRMLMQRQVKSMPDLSFVPEPVFLKEGKANPVSYGQKQKAAIGRLVEIADLTLRPFSEASGLIAQALDSERASERYWGLITCSAFGTKATTFYAKAKELAANDPSNLVRVRAAEFLGLTGAADPRPTILAALKRSRDRFEVGLILNTVTLLRDGKPGYDFDLNEYSAAVQETPIGKENVVARRLEYLKK
ncbi:MAG: sulfatase-like hydrolase/transferase [Phycisphaerales bacterium]|nr:MAG: sulfatase-like hydrolase/transferase [Phycisphaerales bacterium]